MIIFNYVFDKVTPEKSMRLVLTFSHFILAIIIIDRNCLPFGGGGIGLCCTRFAFSHQLSATVTISYLKLCSCSSNMDLG